MEDRQVRGHALLVGSPGTTLQGIDQDVREMAEMLRARGFVVDTRTGDRATRAGILAGYDALIDSARADEPAVFYYAGHGFHAFPPTEPTKSWQGICPTDFHDQTDDDFHGITAWELSLKQARLTARTRNVTTILDCCFASQMSRDAAVHGAASRAVPHPIRSGFKAHLEALRAMDPGAFDAVGTTGNQDAVRVVACGQNESAYEYRCSDGLYRGAFTEALLAVVREVGDVAVSWASIIASIQARVVRRFVVQRPGGEGPLRRGVFSLEEHDGSDAATIVATPAGFRLGAGQIRGVTVGDVYGVMPSSSRTYRSEDAIAEIEVSELQGTFCNAVLRCWKNRHAALPNGAIALPIERTAARHAVTIEVPDAMRAAVEAAIAATPTLRVAAPGEPAVLPMLRLRDGALTIEDRIGALFRPARFPDELQRTVKDLSNLGAAQGLRELEGEHGVCADEIEIEWGTVERGRMCRMLEHGGALALRDRVYVRVRSTAKRPLFVHILNVGLRGKISLLTRFAHTGVRLSSDGPEFVLGRNLGGTVEGLELLWPDGLPRDTPRMDEFVVIATVMAANLESLETVEQLTGERGTASKLRGLLAQLYAGSRRAVSSPSSFDGFLVKRLSYLLHPQDAAIGGLSFQIDDNPHVQSAPGLLDAWLAPEHALEPEVVIAIQIAELTIERVEELSRDVRVDVLVCTRSQSAASYTTWTRRCHGIIVGSPLELDGGLVFQGPVRGFFDFYVWVSRDTGNHPDLEDLLARRAVSREFTDAARSLSLDDSVSTLPWIAATGASAVLARHARDALLEAPGPSIGVYRTSHPVNGRPGKGWQTERQRNSDVSVSFLIKQLGIEKAAEKTSP